MNTAQFIHASLEFSGDALVKLAQDMKSAPLTFPTPTGGNHPLWIVGHIASSEAKLVHEFGLRIPSAYDHWFPVFGPGTTPVADASIYPSYAAVLEAFEKTRALTLNSLLTMQDADFDQPSGAPEHFKDILGTVGDCFRLAIFHAAVHTGQLTDCRRAANRKPILFDPTGTEFETAEMAGRKG